MTATIPGDATEVAAPAHVDDRPAEPARLSTVPRAGRERLLALDVFRGMTVAGMLLVNNPGSWDAIYPPLESRRTFRSPPAARGETTKQRSYDRSCDAGR